MKASTILRAGLAVTTFLLPAACSTKAPETRTAAGDGFDRTVLPIQGPTPPTVTTLDARDATAPPRFEVKAPTGAPNVVIVLIDDIGFGHSSAFGGPIQMPTLEKLAGEWTALQPVPHHRALQPDAHGPADRPQSPHQQRRRDHGTGHGVRRQYRHPSAERGDAGRNPAPERVQHGRLRQISRDAALGSLDLGPLRSLAHRLGLRQVLRLHRRRNQPVGARDLRRCHARRAQADARLPLHGRHDQPGDQLGQRPAGPDARQTLLHVLRARRDPCAAPRAEGVDRQVQGPVQRRLGQAARGDLRPPAEDGHHSAGYETDAAAERNSGVGRHERQPEAPVRAPDGNLRRVRRADRLRSGPAGRSAERDRRARQHDLLLHRRRQRLERGGRARRHLQRNDGAERHRRKSRRDDEPHR